MTPALQKAAFEAKPGDITEIIESEEDIQLARIIAQADSNRLVKVHYVLIGADLFAPMIKISDEEAEKHYTANKTKYERPLSYELEYLLADTADIAADIKPSDPEIEKAYEQLKPLLLDRRTQTASGGPVYRPLSEVRKGVTAELCEHLARQKADEQARQARALLAADAAKTFRDIAASQGKVFRHEKSVDYKPELETRNSKPETRIPWPLQEVAGLNSFLAAAKPGDTSPVLRGYSGPVIVRLIKTRPALVPPFDEVKETARKNVALERGLAQATETARKVIEKVQEPTAQALQAAAAQFTIHTKQTHNMDVKETRFLTRRDAAYDPTVASLFSLRPGEISEPPITAGEKADACFLAAVVESRQLPLDPRIADSLADQARSERLMGLIKTIRGDLRLTEKAE